MAGTATEYIQHHLTHLNNIGAKQGSIVDFSVFNFDTAVFSILMMLLAVWLMYSAAKKATSGVPGKWQCAVEMLVDMVSEQAIETRAMSLLIAFWFCAAEAFCLAP